MTRRRGPVVGPPGWTEPMLATLTDRWFSDPGWIFEPKLDGIRCLAFGTEDSVQMYSRNRLTFDERYPELHEALERQPTTGFIVDGEIVAFEAGRTSFSRLQRRMQVSGGPRAGRVPVYLYLFDILRADGEDVTGLPLRERKSVLRSSIAFQDPIRLTRHRNGEGEAFVEELCAKGWEGVVAKRADSVYQPGRSRDWLKFKCVNEQEFVVGGFTEPKGSRQAFGALLIGYHQDGDLVYAGKVGTGFGDATLQELGRRLIEIEQDRPPFTAGKLPRLRAHWVRPELVAQVGFAEWTRDGQLRHPRFLGLREDKAARDVVRERPS